MPKARQIDHVSIAVPSIDEALVFFQKVFDVDPAKVRRFGGSDWNGALFKAGASKFELLEPNDPNGFLARFINTRGPGVHHVTVQMKDIKDTRRKLDELGIPTFGEHTDEGIEEVFIHPKNAYGVLFQFIEEVWEVQEQDD